MAREEQFLGYGYSCGGGGDGSGSGGSGGDNGGGSVGRVSKKVKQKKVPQRGLGVAQLEKIRLEEQQKMEASNVLGRSDLAAFLPIPCPKFTSGSISDVSGSGGEMESKAFSGLWPRLWSGEYSLVGEKQRLDHGFRCEAPVDGNCSEAVPVLPPLVLPRRSSCQFSHPPPSPPLMVNTTPGIMRSSVGRSQMEPPSNQSSRDGYAPSWLGEEKMVGTKRPYPFSFESPQAPPLHRNLSSGCVIPVSCRSDELALSSDGSRAQSEPRNKCIREGPLSLSPLSKWIPGEVSREDPKLSGEFLTLAPPAGSPPSNSMQYSGKQEHKLPGFESFASQESVKAQTHQSGPSGSAEQPFSFVPIKHQVEQTSSPCLSNCNDRNGETIDLNLKL